MNWTRDLLLVSFMALLLGGCATTPTGPTVTVYPGPGKPFEVFQADDYTCRQWAQQQIGGASPSQTANQNLATGAVVGTLAGAGLGAAVGSASGNAGAGAAIGAGAGLLTGTAVASGPAASSQVSRSRGATISPISNACMRGETRSLDMARRKQARRRWRSPPPRTSFRYRGHMFTSFPA